MKRTISFSALLFLACAPVFLGIFHSGFFVTDDGNWMVIRLSAFYEMLRYGQFPVRFLLRLNNGYGYPVADFLYPLFLYLGSLIHIAHVNFIITIKLLFGISLFASAIGCFLWLRGKLGDVAACTGAIVYTLFPYHLWDITKRGSLGEVLAMAIVPFILWQIEKENILLTGFGIGLLILSHNTLALLFLLLICIYMLLERKLQVFFSVGIGLMLSMFFWLPALFDTQYTVFQNTRVANFSQYFLSQELYPLIGIITFFILLLSLVVVFKKPHNQLVFFICTAFVSLSLTTSSTKAVWVLLHLGTYIQFPFRFLSLTALSIGYLCAYCVAHWQKKHSIILASIILILLFISSWQFFFAKSYSYFSDSYYATNEDTTTVQNEYMPRDVKELPKVVQPKITASNAKVKNVSEKGSTLSFQIISPQSTLVTLAIVYFPGWQGTDNGESISLEAHNPYGFIQLYIPAGDHNIRIWFGESSIRMIADIISFITLVGLGVVYLLKMKNVYE